MKTGSVRKTLLACVAVAALLAAAVLGVGAAQAGTEQALLKPHQRALQPGELDAAAEDIPLATALWDNHNYYGGLLGMYDENATTIAPSEVAETVEAGNNGLAQAGIIPESVAALAIQEGLADDGTRFPSGLFARYGNMILYKDQLAVIAFLPMYKHGGPFDVNAALANYVQYLGLEVLDDWQPAYVFNVQNTEAAELYSESAQLLVQVIRDNRGEDTLMLGVYPMTREAFAQQNRPDGYTI